MKREKYIGLQSKIFREKKFLGCMGDYSCLFLCLCSIAEEFLDSQHYVDMKVDVLSSALWAKDAGLLGDDWTCRDSVKILEGLTGFRWKREEVKKLPAVLARESFSVEKWYNKKTGFTHFRRRWGDTLDDSKTVKNGVLVCFYVFSFLGVK